MSTDKNLHLLATNLLKKSKLIGNIHSITPLAGDASGRQYFRITLSESDTQTVVMMCSIDLKGPIVFSKREINPHTVFTELSPFLNNNNYPVPVIYSQDGLNLLLEDVGDMPLWHFSLNKLTQEEQKIAKKIGKNYLFELYKKAIDLIFQLQRISPNYKISAFERSLTENEYFIESKRFIEHFLLENYNFSKTHLAEIELEIKKLSKKVSLHPKTQIHRDFMPWNIHVCTDGNLKVIDYQDMLLGSCFYDLVSLIHDRDADISLGDNFCNEITNYFFQNCDYNNPQQHYHEVVVQRYLRLSGQFNLLSEKLNKPLYKKWINGSLIRTGRSLAKLPEFSKLAELLTPIPEIRDGLLTPWNF